ncbi:DUF364 domain-containing protein [Kosmotoga pacifica]|uniref:DUF364 domain-containing protein n=1 Tax=Kosmotoga pacifica TaxID=1330330 RepID=A0A0G2ZAU4_9BACT|nr:DUF364 domain-containing protein [Kosmotoga pacifica]AKI96699.1 hypothetical protein IX53_01410 [Kosmotoga pacifica]
MNSIFDRVLQYVTEVAGEELVIDYIVGTGITAVKLEKGEVGIAHLFRDEIPSGCTLFNELVSTPIKLSEFLKLGERFHPVTVSLALAACNAVLGRYFSPKDCSEKDVFDILEITPEDTVGFVGDFRPLTNSLREKVKKVIIFERHPGSNYLPDWALPWKLKDCDVLIVTGTTVMNRTIDMILNAARTDRIVVYGPSTPLLSEVFPGNVRVLGGALITDGELAMKIAARAGGTKNLFRESAAKKVTIVK